MAASFVARAGGISLKGVDVTPRISVFGRPLVKVVYQANYEMNFRPLFCGERKSFKEEDKMHKSLHRI